jgi:hypothetical protein
LIAIFQDIDFSLTQTCHFPSFELTDTVVQDLAICLKIPANYLREQISYCIVFYTEFDIMTLADRESQLTREQRRTNRASFQRKDCFRCHRNAVNDISDEFVGKQRAMNSP